MEDICPDMRRDMREGEFAPTYWRRLGHYNMVVCGSILGSPWFPYAVYGENFFHEYDLPKDVPIGFSGGVDTPHRDWWLDKFKGLGLQVLSGTSGLITTSFCRGVKSWLTVIKAGR